MRLTQRLFGQVATDVQNRGHQYYQRGAVKIIEGDAFWVEATVQGSQQYDVELTRTKKAVKVACSCAYFLDNGMACKHIWATILCADAKGYLRPSDGMGRLVLEPDADLLDEWGASDDWDDGDDADWDEREGRVSGGGYAPSQNAWSSTPRPGPKKSSRKQGWKQHLSSLRTEKPSGYSLAGRGAWPSGREILYVVDVPATLQSNALTVELGHRMRKKDGDWSKPKFERITLEQIPSLPDPADRQITSLLVGAKQPSAYGFGYSYGYNDSTSRRYQLSETLQEMLIPLMCRTGRCRLRLSPEAEDLRTLHWDDGEPWKFWLDVAPDLAAKKYQVEGVLRRGEERMPLSDPVLLVHGGLVFWNDRAGRLEDFGAFDWIPMLRKSGPLSVPVTHKDNLLKELLRLPSLPPLNLPEELRLRKLR